MLDFRMDHERDPYMAPSRGIKPTEPSWTTAARELRQQAARQRVRRYHQRVVSAESLRDFSLKGWKASGVPPVDTPD
jgi:hypothetical protein